MSTEKYTHVTYALPSVMFKGDRGQLIEAFASVDDDGAMVMESTGNPSDLDLEIAWNKLEKLVNKRPEMLAEYAERKTTNVH